MVFLKKYWAIILVLLVGLLLRLYLATLGNHIDLIINAGWGDWLYKNGPSGFYTNSVWIYAWPTQLPLINSIYSFNFTIFGKLLWVMTYIGNFLAENNLWPNLFAGWFKMIDWFGWKYFAETPFPNGYLYAMKLLPIFADLGLALIVYQLGKRMVGEIKARVVSLLFLLLPFGWYISSLWGQYDQLAAFLALTSLLVLFAKGERVWGVGLSAAMMFAAQEIKLYLLPLVPLYLVVLLSQKQKLLNIVITVGVVVIMYLATTLPFSSGNLVAYFSKEIIPMVFNPDRLGLVNRAFNFWQFLSPAGGWADSYKFLGIKALYWGMAGLIIAIVMGARTFLKDKTVRGLTVGIFLISGGAYIFATGMVDRYFFLGIISLGILTFYFPKLLGIWIVSALVFSFNLFYSWGYPLLSGLNVWGNLLVIRVMSLIQTTLFVTSVVLVKQQLNKVLVKGTGNKK